MKRIVFTAAMMISLMFSAQIDLRSTRYGITGGATYSAVTNAHNPSGPRYSGYGGLLALIPVDSSDQFYLQPGVEYLGAGETGRDKNAKSSPYYNAVYGNSYISVPIYFKAYLSEAESEFFALAGPKFNFLIGQTIRNAPLRYTIEGDPDKGMNGKAASFNFALGFGIGYSYKRMLEITARYDLGLSNTYPGLMKDLVVDPNSAKRKSEQVISIGLSYIFQ
jgi:hypothetical protein